MESPIDLRYSREHEWVRIEGPEAVIGITAHAAKELGDIVFIETPRPGTTVGQAQVFGVVESVKAVSDLFSPVGGTVVRVNQELGSAPELVNQDPYGKGWMIAVTLKDPGEVAGLMSAEEYKAFLSEIGK